MITPSVFTTEPGDSPLRSVPDDYDGGGIGRWLVLPDGPDAGRRVHFWERRYGEGDGPVVLQELVRTAWGRSDRPVGTAALLGAWDPLAKPTVLAQWREALPDSCHS